MLSYERQHMVLAEGNAAFLSRTSELVLHLQSKQIVMELEAWADQHFRNPF